LEPQRTYKIIISGGGTGGHIFPAIAIADGLRNSGLPVEILFVGAKGRMEMEKVPAAGYPIEGLNIAGFQRSMSPSNLSFPFKVVKSLVDAGSIVSRFQPDIAVGVGGYASGPLLFAASLKGIPTLIQEQNSYPGVTNKILSKRAEKICVAYPGMEKFFSAEKIVYTGNPVRALIAGTLPTKAEACAFYGLDANKPVIFSFGGSLGAKTLNNSVEASMNEWLNSGAQVIWQTGSFYNKEVMSRWENKIPAGVRILEFIKEMQMAYAAADIIISRAGALSISELCIVGKATILIPSPNVAEDHQTKNALSLTEKGAAIMISDTEAPSRLGETIAELLNDVPRQNVMGEKIKAFAKPDATKDIVQEILKIIQK
jgi:UDP-N-acetylglucosamine--N-acetylmuramyl-(pentapeptide) pyrophosphoryl-undecaprenol N-acetylglucosamine transferase